MTTKENGDIISLESLVGIDTEKGLAIAQNNPALYRRLLTRFHAGQKGFEETFRAAQQDEDSQAVIRAAHTLVGSAGNIGASGTQQAALKLETACKQQGDSEAIETALQQVIPKLNSVIESLEQFIADTTHDEFLPSSETNLQQITTSVEKLRALLEMSDPDAIEQIDVVSRLMPQQDLRKLKGVIDRFDFETALELLQDISE